MWMHLVIGIGEWLRRKLRTATARACRAAGAPVFSPHTTSAIGGSACFTGTHVRSDGHEVRYEQLLEHG
jgi:hypothetical protein